MFTWPLQPRLPSPAPDTGRLTTRLHELFAEFAKVGRQLQCPPTLRAVKSGVQAVSVTTPVLVPFQTLEWDTHGYWVAASSKYMPLDFAGYYRVSAKLSFAPQTVTTGNRRCAIYRNGSEYSSVTVPQTSTLRVVVLSTDLVYLNGATDYIEIYAVCGEAVDIEAETYRTSLAIEYVGAKQLL
jgi:hypothetical protein